MVLGENAAVENTVPSKDITSCGNGEDDVVDSHGPVFVAEAKVYLKCDSCYEFEYHYEASQIQSCSS